MRASRVRATAALLLIGAGTLALTFTLVVNAGGGAPDPTSEPTPEPAAESPREAAATPAVRRAVIPGLAADWTPEPCFTNVPDPCALPIIPLTVRSADGERSVTLAVEVANRPDQRYRGLMFRDSLDELAGMIFIFANQRAGGFWMQNTFIPLDIAYLDADGTVLEIVHGTPLSTEILTPAQPYFHTLEVNSGWFERHDFGPGDRVELPADLTAAQ